jgi:hypothetical protein
MIRKYSQLDFQGPLPQSYDTSVRGEGEGAPTKGTYRELRLDCGLDYNYHIIVP